MRPLSVTKYYINNKKKFAAVFCTVFLSVSLLALMQMLISSLYYSLYASWIRPMEEFSIVQPVSEEATVDDNLLEEIRKQDFVEKTVPAEVNITNIINTFGGKSGTLIFNTDKSNTNVLLEKLDLKVVKGRLPNAGSNEVALHWRIAANKSMKLGDELGDEVDKKERLKGKFTVVGLLDGPTMVSLMSNEKNVYVNSNEASFGKGFLVFHKAESIRVANDFLNKVPVYKARITSYDVQMQDISEIVDTVKSTILMIQVMLTIILSITVGMTSYLYFYQRRSQFGILYAMGHTKNAIIKMLIKEIAGMNLTGFLLGILTAFLTGYILNLIFYISKGQPLQLWNWEYVISTFFIPLFVILFSAIPVWRMLGKLDPISIIEGVS